MQESFTDTPLVVDNVGTEGECEDIAILFKWVKKELFVKVKFLYNMEKDCMIEGFLYNEFHTDCKDRLVGLKLNAHKDQDYKRLYAHSLWNRATKKKKNIIADGLNTRRSSIYSAMQNRFTGKPLMFVIAMYHQNNACSQCWLTPYWIQPQIIATPVWKRGMCFQAWKHLKRV
jgi:hypothetical protein